MLNTRVGKMASAVLRLKMPQTVGRLWRHTDADSSLPRAARTQTHNYQTQKNQNKGPRMQQTHWEPDQREKRGGNPLNPKILTPLNPANHLALVAIQAITPEQPAAALSDDLQDLGGLQTLQPDSQHLKRE